MKRKNSILAFAVAILGVCIIPFINPTPQENKVGQQEQVVETPATNSIQSATNTFDRSNSNLDWFKDSSNYIWDGWKIK